MEAKRAKVTAGGATASLVCAIIGFFVFGIILGPIAIVLAIRAKRKIREDPELGGDGIATAGLVIGIVETVLWVVGIAIIVIGVACLWPAIAKPTVGYVPQGWYLSEDSPYGTYEDIDGTLWGLIEYIDADDFDFVMIFYGDVPSLLQGHEADPSALITKAVEWSIFVPEETGTMTVAGHTAGYAKAYDSVQDYYEMKIVFVEGSVCVDIYTIYTATILDESQAMSLINSISF